MKNLSKKKKIIILTVMIALLLVTGYVNVALNSSLSAKTESVQTATTNANFYSAYRLERENTRTQEIQFYDSILTSTASAEAKAEAESNKLALIKQIEKELVTEGIIRGKGFEDAIVTSSSANVNVFIKAAELTELEVAQIASVVMQQLQVELDKIIIIPSV